MTGVGCRVQGVVQSVGVRDSPATAQRASRQTGHGRFGTHNTVRARFWPWLSVKSPENLSSGSLFARQQCTETDLTVSAKHEEFGLIVTYCL